MIKTAKVQLLRKLERSIGFNISNDFCADIM